MVRSERRAGERRRAWATRDAWAARNWSPAVGAEHLATRERVALFDITPFAKLRVWGSDAVASWSASARTGSTGPSGSIVYTSMLTPPAGSGAI